jgi:two-component sensor histidine kinase
VPNLRLYALGVPLALLASVSVHATQPSIGIFAGYFAANVLSFAFTALVFWPLYLVSKRLVIARGGKLSIWFLLVLGAVLGFTKQISTVALVVWFGLESSFAQALEARTVTPLIGFWFVLAAATLQAGRSRFEAIRRQLVSERAHRAAARGVDGVNKPLAQSPHLTNLFEEVNAQLSAERLTPGDLSGRQLAALLRQIVNNQIRPLSHQIWQHENESVPGYRLGDLAARAIAKERYPVVTIVTVYALTSTPTLIAAAPEGTGLAWVLTLSLAVAVGLVLANATKRLRPNPKLTGLNLVLTISLIVTTASVLASLTLGQLVGLNQVLLLIVSIGWLSTITVVAGVVTVARRTYAEQLASLEGLLAEEIDLEAAHATSRLRDREIANYLHSSVQNQLLAQALRVESESDVDLAHELQQIIALLEPRPEVSSLSIADQLASLAADWHGLIKIEFAIDPRAQLANATQQLVGLIAAEAVNNAYRHGGADEIAIELQSHGDNPLQSLGATLIVRDNGSGVPGKTTATATGARGIGSSLFDSAGPWSLTTDAAGTVLKISFS